MGGNFIYDGCRDTNLFDLHRLCSTLEHGKRRRLTELKKPKIIMDITTGYRGISSDWALLLTALFIAYVRYGLRFDLK